MRKFRDIIIIPFQESQNFKYLKNEKSFFDEIKNTFYNFSMTFILRNKKIVDTPFNHPASYTKNFFKV